MIVANNVLVVNHNILFLKENVKKVTFKIVKSIQIQIIVQNVNKGISKIKVKTGLHVHFKKLKKIVE